MTSALLFVALLVLVDVSYRRWIRRSVERRRNLLVDATDPDAANVALTPRAEDLVQENFDYNDLTDLRN